MDDDCEDQALVPTKHCMKCRPAFVAGNPVYPQLVKRGRFWCCIACGSSYGENPHPDLSLKENGMSTEKRIEMIQLIQELKYPDEKPGSVVLRSLRALRSLPEIERVRDEWCREYVKARDAHAICAGRALSPTVASERVSERETMTSEKKL